MTDNNTLIMDAQAVQTGARYEINGQVYPVDIHHLPQLTLDEAEKIAPYAHIGRPNLHPPFGPDFKTYTPEQIYAAEELIRKTDHEQILKKMHDDKIPMRHVTVTYGATPKPSDNVQGVNVFSPPNAMSSQALATTEPCTVYTFDTNNIAFSTLVGYVVISTIIAVIVGRYVHKNSQIFLSRLFADRTLALAANRLLLLGFYLVNLGYILMTVNMPDDTFRNMKSNAMWLQFLTSKVGLAVIVLGAMHVFNMAVLWLLSSNKKDCAQTTAIR